MTSQQAIEDINYATGIAKSAKESPLVGGAVRINVGSPTLNYFMLTLGNSHWTDRRAGSGTRLPVGGFCYLR